MNIFGDQILKLVVVNPRLGILRVVEELVDLTGGNVSKIDRHKAIVATSSSSVQDKVSVFTEAFTKVLVG